MYKGASQSLVRRTAVDRPHPSRGYIDGPSDPAAILANIATLSLAQAADEKDRLAFEMKRLEQELAVAKVTGKARQIAAIGQRKATTQDRLAAVNRRIKEVNQQTRGSVLSAAVREICDGETAHRIFIRANELFHAQGTPTRSAETEGLSPKDGGPVAESDAPNLTNPNSTNQEQGGE